MGELWAIGKPFNDGGKAGTVGKESGEGSLVISAAPGGNSSTLATERRAAGDGVPGLGWPDVCEATDALGGGVGIFPAASGETGLRPSRRLLELLDRLGCVGAVGRAMLVARLSATRADVELDVDDGGVVLATGSGAGTCGRPGLDRVAVLPADAVEGLVDERLGVAWSAATSRSGAAPSLGDAATAAGRGV